jgi:5-methylcytosine-specific restriction protein A
VKLVCGPPAAGKTTYVKAHAGADDIVIDLDDIAREWGIGRDRSGTAVENLLEERNVRLAGLAQEPPERIAWVVLTAPSRSLRAWWSAVLGVRPGDLVLLIPPTKELYRRIMSDPDRRGMQVKYLQLAAKWILQERRNDPGVLRGDADLDGYPTDPLHPWNRGRESVSF